jgi:putative protease
MTLNKKIELLAPAGNLQKMKTALAYGADAVYLGIPDFSLRVRINDFNLEDIKEAIAYAHHLKRKVYVTINIFAHEKHLVKLPKYLGELKKMRPDGLIISDPGILALAKKYLPKIALHLSTQANCTNGAAVKFWYQNGVRRVILGREVTLEEIKLIHKACPKMELEYFVHGAMCMAYSGRCFLSKEFVDRSGNLGDCVQPCRWEYGTYIKAKGHDEILEVVSEKHGTYLLNSKDLCLVEYLQDLAKAGVSSFKIEGRAKSVYYIANIVGIYKEALAHPKKTVWLKKELATKLVHRGYTAGFLLGKTGEQNVADSHNQVKWEFCGQVEASAKERILIKVHNTIKIGDAVEIILPFYDIIKLKVKKMWDYQANQEILEAHGGGGSQKVWLEVKESKKIPTLAVLRRQTN